MTTGKKATLGVVSALLLWGLFLGTWSCTRAEMERSRIKPAMSVSDVFHTIDAWDLCLGTYLNPATNEFAHFSATNREAYHIRRHGDTDSLQVSQEELIRAVEKQMREGQSWGIQFTYLRPPTRATFRVDFDSHGKVKNVTGVVLGP